MNIRFYNLGQIKETELDLRPMTVIIGPNNSNKTYIAYSIYGLWQNIANNRRAPSFTFQERTDGSLSIQLETLYRAFIPDIKRSEGNFAEELGFFFQDSSGLLFSNTQYEIDISRQEFDIALQALLHSHLSGYLRLSGRFSLSLDQDALVVSAVNQSDDDSKAEDNGTFEPRALSFEIRIMLADALRQQLFSQPCLLPAERNAFVITYKVLANRRLKLMLDAQRRLFSSRKTSAKEIEAFREAGEVRYPQPIEDFLELLFEIETESNLIPDEQSQENGHKPTRRRSSRSGLGKLASDVEAYIQNGNKINFRQTALGGQEIMVDVGDGLNIDLYNASSSIKQLTPLLLYLRYRAAKGDLLIIDEPEMNLHPESQAKLLEILAMLVNQGVYVLLTTHSPYLMAHLNNLTQAEEMPAATKRRQAKSLYLENPASLLTMDQVSAYEMRDNQLHSLKDPSYGIRWDTLSDVSLDLQQKYFQIYEEGHNQTGAKTTRKSSKVESK